MVTQAKKVDKKHKSLDPYKEAEDILDKYYEGTEPMDPWSEIMDD